MKILLLRHGETTGDVEERYGGDFDDHLSENGKKQSEELGQSLKDRGMQIIYCSPKIRAIESAEIVNKVLNVKLEIVEDMRERNNYGVLTGMTKAEAKEKFPDEVRKLVQKNDHHVAESEDYEHFKERILRSFERLTAGNGYEGVAIMTHSGPIKCILEEMLDVEPNEIPDCAVIELKKSGPAIFMVARN